MTIKERTKNKQEKGPIEPQKEPKHVRDSEEEAEQACIEIDGIKFLSPLPPYIPPRKPYA